MQNQTHFTIGSAADADIRICEPTVSQHHCDLRWQGDAWVIRDCDSTNGTFINDRRISQTACLGPDDRVTLGRGVKLDIPAPPTEPKIVQMPDASQRSPLLSQSSTHRRPRVAMLAMLGGIGIVCLLCGVVLIGLWLSPGSPLPSAGEATTEGSVADKASPTATQQGIPETPTEIAAATSATQELGPVWALVVESADRQRRLLLGTAVAIEGNRLLCLASLIDAAQSVQSQYPVVALESPRAVGELIPIRSHELSPQYQAARKELVEFRKELEAKLSAVSETDQPALDESLAWSERLDIIMNDLATHDLAYLVVAEPLSPFVAAVVPDQPESATCLLKGFPTLAMPPSITNDLAKYQLDIEARWIPPRSDQSKAATTTVEFQSISSVVQPQSLACFDSQGRLIGLCGASESSAPVGEMDRLPSIAFTKFW